MVAMSINDPNETAKNPAETTDATSDDILDFLEGFQRYLDANVPKVRAACARLDARIRAERAEREDEEPNTEPEPHHVPSLAILSNGKVVLSVVHLEGADISSREIWQGVLLNEAEASDALERITDAADEAAGRVAHRILFKGKKRDDEPGEGGNEL
jgi:hypothetical protein